MVPTDIADGVGDGGRRVAPVGVSSLPDVLLVLLVVVLVVVVLLVLALLGDSVGKL